MTKDNGKTPAEPEFDRRQLIKLAIELGPLIVFFATFVKSGNLYTATVVLIAATLASLLASRVFLGHVAMMPIVTAVLVTVFGGLTIWLQNPTFIKMKPTVLYLLFAAALMIGLRFGAVLLRSVLGEAMSYTDEGWRRLTVRWSIFFVSLAVANEVVWRGADWLWADVPHVEGVAHPADQLWVNFKTFGFLPLTMAFAIAQFVLMKKYELVKDEQSK